MRAANTVRAELSQSLMSVRSPLLQRKCACGNSAGLASECGECQSKPFTKQRGGGELDDSTPFLHDLIQPKLIVGAPDDRYEQEADRVAEQVMRMPAPALRVQRQSQDLDQEELEEESALRLKPLAETITPLVQRSPDPAQPTAPQPNLETQLNASRSGDRPLPNEVRQFMEPRFGFDFSKVQVHNDADAVQMNRELGAQAFTHGSDVYFGAGKSPGNNELTAHELTHVVQQTGEIQFKSTGGQQSSSLLGNFISEPTIQCDFLESVGRGWDMYWRLNDEGAPLARTLMEWRMTGFGLTYESPSQWSEFMRDRPEIQRAMASKFEQLAFGFAATGGSGTFNDSITNVRLDELESMRLTLHGCHHIEITGDYEVSGEGSEKIVLFRNIHFIWVDRADLHPGTETELDSGGVVDDQEFTSAGWDYDIRIHFFMPRTSTWRVSGSSARHERGWPPVTGVPAAGFRG